LEGAAVMAVVSTKLRKSAKGQTCSFQIPGICNGDPETTVLCHAPSEVKAAGIKSPDTWAAFGCAECHQALDTHQLNRADEQFFWLRGIQRTQSIWVQMGLMVVPIDVARQKPSSKIMPRRHITTREVF
jgi:hypothetical protein